MTWINVASHIYGNTLWDTAIHLGITEHKVFVREWKARTRRGIWNIFFKPDPLTWVNNWSQTPKLQSTLWANIYDLVYFSQIPFVFYKGWWKQPSEGNSCSEFSCYNFKVQHIILCSWWLPVSLFPQRSRLTAISILKTMQTFHPYGLQRG